MRDLQQVQVPNCGDKGHKPAQCGHDKGNRRGKRGILGERDVVDVAGAESSQDLGDLGICALEGVWEVGAGKAKANSRRTSRQG